MITCRCGVTGPGELLFGTWLCDACVALEAQAKAQRKKDLLAEIRKRHADGKCCVHVPIHGSPIVGLTDDAAQKKADEWLACHWTRQDDGSVTFWGEW